MLVTACSACEVTRAELALLRAKNAGLAAELERTLAQLCEVTKLNELQAADIERYKTAIASQDRPNQPERVAPDKLQFAFERIIEQLTSGEAAKQALLEVCAEVEQKVEETKPPKKKARPHGRRKLEMAGLPVEEVRVVPEEVKACGGVGWQFVGEESSDRLGFRPALFVRLRVTREKWVRVAAPEARPASEHAASPQGEPAHEAEAATELDRASKNELDSARGPEPMLESSSERNAVPEPKQEEPEKQPELVPEPQHESDCEHELELCSTAKDQRNSEARPERGQPADLDQRPGCETAEIRIAIADLPECFWPRVMADTSVIAEVMLSKYDYCLPLNRQERITRNRGFVIPRSTQADWLDQAHDYVRHLVDAMHAESIAKSFCIATDATGAPIRIKDGTHPWHVFVFISDVDHVTFRHSPEHTSDAISEMLKGFSGRLLSDAASIYDALFRAGVISVSDWAHFRRYLWRAVLTEPDLAYEGLALVHHLFMVARAAKALPEEQRTSFRAARATPILAALDAWIERRRGTVEPGGRMAAAITYYTNQREGLRRFLEDGRLSLHNNDSERELRNLVLGLHNWKHFENETGLKWYTTFRSLITSSLVQDLNPLTYLTQMLRLIPHWPKPRVIELAPKHWRATVDKLDERHRAIIMPPWEKAMAPPALLPSSRVAQT